MLTLQWNWLATDPCSTTRPRSADEIANIFTRRAYFVFLLSAAAAAADDDDDDADAWGYK